MGIGQADFAMVLFSLLFLQHLMDAGPFQGTHRIRQFILNAPATADKLDELTDGDPHFQHGNTFFDIFIVAYFCLFKKCQSVNNLKGNE